MYMRPENIKHFRCIAQRTEDHHAPCQKKKNLSHTIIFFQVIAHSWNHHSTNYSIFFMIQYLDMHKTHKNLVVHSEMI